MLAPETIEIVPPVDNSLLPPERMIFPACDIPVSISQISKDELVQSQALLTCNSIRGLAAVGSMFNHQNKLVKSLPIDEQTLMLCKKLIDLYPQYQ